MGEDTDGVLDTLSGDLSPRIPRPLGRLRVGIGNRMATPLKRRTPWTRTGTGD